MVHILFSPGGTQTKKLVKPSFALKAMKVQPFSTFTPGGHVSKTYKKRVASELAVVGGSYAGKRHRRRVHKKRTLKPCKAHQVRSATKPRRCKTQCKRYASKKAGHVGKCKYRKTASGKRVVVTTRRKAH